eukprot:gene13593-biopygen15598
MQFPAIPNRGCSPQRAIPRNSQQRMLTPACNSPQFPTEDAHPACNSLQFPTEDAHHSPHERGQREVSFWVPTGDLRTEVGGSPPLFFTDGERETGTRQRRSCSRPAGDPDV